MLRTHAQHMLPAATRRVLVDMLSEGKSLKGKMMHGLLS